MSERHSRVTSSEFRMERRALLKWSAAALLTGRFLNPHSAVAAGECSSAGLTSDLLGAQKTSLDGNPDFLYWIDGPMNANLSGYAPDAAQKLKTRARISCTMHLPNTRNSFIETVILTDKDYKIIAQQFYDSSAGLPVGGFAPYVVFENIVLDSDAKYKLIFVQNNGNSPAVMFEHEISNAQPSRLEYANLTEAARNKHIPSKLIDDMKIAHALAGAGHGFITTPYCVLPNDSKDHSPRAKILNIDSENGQFEILIDMMHAGDPLSPSTHFMRYFLVLDPVGRVLGALRRISDTDDDCKADTAVLVRRGFWTPVKKTDFVLLPPAERLPDACYGHRISNDQLVTNSFDIATSVDTATASDAANPVRAYVRMHTGLTATTDGKKTFTAVTIPATTVNILNCPHIQILTDDVAETAARCCIKLR